MCLLSEALEGYCTHPDVVTLTRPSEAPGGESRSVRPGDGGPAPVTLVPAQHGGGVLSQGLGSASAS